MRAVVRRKEPSISYRGLGPDDQSLIPSSSAPYRPGLAFSDGHNEGHGKGHEDTTYWWGTVGHDALR